VSHIRRQTHDTLGSLLPDDERPLDEPERVLPEHAVISTFDLFSIGGELTRHRSPDSKVEPVLYQLLEVGPSSSHTVGPMRAGKIFIQDLEQLDLLEKV
jgi:hypothetical protein